MHNTRNFVDSIPVTKWGHNTFPNPWIFISETKENEQRFNPQSGNALDDSVTVEERSAYFRWNKMTDLLNGALPSDIRVHGIQRTSKRFNPQKSAGSRIYHYLCPSYLFDAEFKAKMVDHLEWKYCDLILSKHCDEKKKVKHSENEENVLNAVWSAKDKRIGYRISEELVDRLQSILQIFVGTKRYHNFSRGVLPNALNVKRYMMSMKVLNASMVRDGIEYLLFELHGASFMYHQIRKMMGFTVSLMRNTKWKLMANDDAENKIICDEKQVIEMAFSADYKMSIPLAPAEGLYLKEVRYDLQYNQKAPPERQIQSEVWNEGIERFIENEICPNVMDNEMNKEDARKGHRFAYWLYELDHRFQFETVRYAKDLKDTPECGARHETKDEYLGRLTSLHSKGTQQILSEK